MIGNPKYPDSPDGNCEDSDSMHDCLADTDCIHDCGTGCHSDDEPTDAQNPYAKPFDEALIVSLRNNTHVSRKDYLR